MENASTIQITDLAYGGDGVGRSDGMAVFVRGALPDEEVRIAIVEQKKRYARGNLLAVTQPSPSRVEPACPIAAECPGCAYQHMDYPAELVWKQRQLRALLMRLGGLAELPDFVPLASPVELAYRNKVVLHVDDSGRIGYFGYDNRTVVDVVDCPLAVPPIREAIADFRQNVLPGLSAGDHVTFRWTNHDGVLSWVNQQAPRAWLTEEVDGTIWKVPPQSFWQVNPAAAPILLETTTRMVRDCAPANLIDLYCGSGLFSLASADDVENVLGVESDSESVRAARHNADSRNSRNALFVQGDAGRIYPEAQDKVDATRTLVLVDPPRGGLSGRLREALMQEKGPQPILYVSCAPDTLARDCQILCRDTYRIREIQLVDLFPRTAHFETLVLLQRT